MRNVSRLLTTLILLASCAPRIPDTPSKKAMGVQSTGTQFHRTVCRIDAPNVAKSVGSKNARFNYYKIPSDCQQKILRTCSSKGLHLYMPMLTSYPTLHKDGKYYADASFSCGDKKTAKVFNDVERNIQNPKKCNTTCKKSR